MAHYDWFVARLKCPRCGFVSPADGSTRLHTYLRDTDDYAPQIYLAVGDSLGDIDLLEFDWSYRTIQEFDHSREMRILQTWSCTNCQAANNWAEIVVRQGVIESIEPTPLNRATLERSHLIETVEARSVAARLTGQTYLDLVNFGADVVAILRERLPDAT